MNDQRMGAILRSARFSIITATPDGIITSFNKEAEDLLGYSADEIVGKYSPALFHKLDEIVEVAKELNIEPGFQVFILKANRGEFDERLWTYVRKDGSERKVRLNITALTTEDNQIFGYMGIAKDVTKEILDEMQIKEQQAMLISSSKLASLGEMAAGIGHEINNPLSIIAGKLDLILQKLENGKLSDEYLKSSIENAVTQTTRISKIIMSLKSLSRNKDNDIYEMNSVKELISNCLILFDEKLKHLGIELLLDISDFQTSCSMTQIEQVISNIISNAIDVNSKGGWIRIEAFDKNIHISDSGPGIPKELIHKIMQPFFTTKEIGKGTGLGLSLSKKIMEIHGGKLFLDESSKNTKFCIQFK